MKDLARRRAVLDGAYARLRADRMNLEQAWPPRPMLSWRDVQHTGLMKHGVCIRCFGFADDPRHWSGSLVAAERLYPLQATVFRGLDPASA